MNMIFCLFCTNFKQKWMDREWEYRKGFMPFQIQTWTNIWWLHHKSEHIVIEL